MPWTFCTSRIESLICLPNYNLHIKKKCHLCTKKEYIIIFQTVLVNGFEVMLNRKTDILLVWSIERNWGGRGLGWWANGHCTYLNKYLIECQSKQTIYYMAMDGSSPTGVSVCNIHMAWQLCTLYTKLQLERKSRWIHTVVQSFKDFTSNPHKSIFLPWNDETVCYP